MTKFNEQLYVFAGTDEEITKKKKKGNVLGDVFKLMESLVSLQEEIEDVVDSIDNADVVEKIKAFDQHIDAMYDSLSEITKDGVRAIRKRDGLPMEEESPMVETAPEPIKPAMITSPKLPFAPK